MLRNGLGELIDSEIAGRPRFVDLFTGSASVAAHVARRYAVPVQAFDIQSFSVVTASAIIGRSQAVDVGGVWSAWYSSARSIFEAAKVPPLASATASDVMNMREWCGGQGLPITQAYGGHYFSASQSVWLDALRLSVPRSGPERDVAIAALVEAGSQCAAAPGHTAQPFQPTATALRFIQEAWGRDALHHVSKAFAELGTSAARVAGEAKREDANQAARSLSAGDLVFVDPPYSGVHYSRFYHVLETIAEGIAGQVSGVGRYPDPSRRPRSLYSMKGQSRAALDDLLRALAEVGASAIVTFPDHQCSNGLSGEDVRDIARQYFDVDDRYVAARFSTLGGYAQSTQSETGRQARQSASEMMLLLRPA
jgi:adenine-specific DNA-methyltransferase